MCNKTCKYYCVTSKNNTKTFYCTNHKKTYLDKYFDKKDIHTLKDSNKINLNELGSNLYEELSKKGTITAEEYENFKNTLLSNIKSYYNEIGKKYFGW